MSRIKLLLDVVEDMRSLADSLHAVATALSQSDQETAAAPNPAPAAPPPPAPAAPPPKAITLEKVRAVLAEKSHDGYTDQVRGLLQKFGAEKLSGVDPKYYAALLKDAEVLAMAPNSHAILSASSSHRWMNCTPSARLEREFADRETEAAAEGTAAHALCEHKLRRALKMRSRKPVSKYDCDEMDGYTDGYVEFVLEQFAQAKLECADPLVLIEQRLDFSCWVPEGFGTGDCLIVADKLLHIIDFKYGQGVLVEAEENPQMMLYALGALRLFDSLYDITEVSMSIYQPRRDNVSTWTISVDELNAWAENVLKPKAELAHKGEGDYLPGPWCQFCKAAVKCRARAEEKLQLARFEFAPPPLLSDEEIEEILRKLDDLTKWASEIQAYAQDAAINHGKVWQGFKLVATRTNRRYTDEEAVIQAAKEAGYTDIFRKSLIPITEMEKLMSKKEFNRILGALVEKPQGRPTLVPVTDKRPALTNTGAGEEFTEIKED